MFYLGFLLHQIQFYIRLYDVGTNFKNMKKRTFIGNIFIFPSSMHFYQTKLQVLFYSNSKPEKASDSLQWQPRNENQRKKLHKSY